VRQKYVIGLRRLQTTWTSRGLLNLTCLSITDMMKWKNPEDIREKFNIKNDFTAEEEEEVMRDREYRWPFNNNNNN
jgi:hypothetical protein